MEEMLEILRLHYLTFIFLKGCVLDYADVPDMVWLAPPWVLSIF